MTVCLLPISMKSVHVHKASSLKLLFCFFFKGDIFNLATCPGLVGGIDRALFVFIYK